MKDLVQVKIIIVERLLWLYLIDSREEKDLLLRLLKISINNNDIL